MASRSAASSPSSTRCAAKTATPAASRCACSPPPPSSATPTPAGPTTGGPLAAGRAERRARHADRRALRGRARRPGREPRQGGDGRHRGRAGARQRGQDDHLRQPLPRGVRRRPRLAPLDHQALRPRRPDRRPRRSASRNEYLFAPDYDTIHGLRPRRAGAGRDRPGRRGRLARPASMPAPAASASRRPKRRRSRKAADRTAATPRTTRTSSRSAAAQPALLDPGERNVAAAAELARRAAAGGAELVLLPEVYPALRYVDEGYDPAPELTALAAEMGCLIAWGRIERRGEAPSRFTRSTRPGRRRRCCDERATRRPATSTARSPAAPGSRPARSSASSTRSASGSGCWSA